jgi:hypothetical protein
MYYGVKVNYPFKQSALCCVCYELQMWGRAKKPVHCVHPEHRKPVLESGQ